MSDRALFDMAVRARDLAYAPYSHYTVGAALLCASGRVYTGVNVENASFGATNCAERTAIFSAVAAGEREFEAMAIAGGRANEDCGHCSPCGICRQVLAEFCTPELKLVLKDGTYRLGELLPVAFTEDDL